MLFPVGTVIVSKYEKLRNDLLYALEAHNLDYA